MSSQQKSQGSASSQSLFQPGDSGHCITLGTTRCSCVSATAQLGGTQPWVYPAPQTQPCPQTEQPLLQQMPTNCQGVEGWIEGLGCSEKGLGQLDARSCLSSKPRGEAAWAETLHICRCLGKALPLCPGHTSLTSSLYPDVLGSGSPHQHQPVKVPKLSSAPGTAGW